MKVLGVPDMPASRRICHRTHMCESHPKLSQLCGGKILIKLSASGDYHVLLNDWVNSGLACCIIGM